MQRDTCCISDQAITERLGGAMSVIREVWWSDGCDQRGMVERDTQTVSVIKPEVWWSDGCDQRGMVERWL